MESSYSIDKTSIYVRRINSRDVLYTIVPIVNYMVLCTL